MASCRRGSHRGSRGQFPYYEGEAEPRVVDSLEGESGRIFVWEEEDSVVVWEVEVPERGLYWIGFEYYPLPGKRASAIRDMKVNGSFPFNEARTLAV